MNSVIILVLLATLLNQTISVTGQLPNIWEIVSKDDRLKTLTTALEAADLVEAGQAPGKLTIFAPTNEAFSKIPSETIQYYSDSQNKDKLVELLSYHAIGDKILTSSDLSTLDLPARLETLIGDFLTVTKQDDQLKINDATIVTSDILASNGIIHIIDTVLTRSSSNK